MSSIFSRRALLRGALVGAATTVTVFATGCSPTTVPMSSTSADPNRKVTLTMWDADQRDTWIAVRDRIIDSYVQKRAATTIEVVSMSFQDLPAKVAVGAETGTLPDLLFSVGYYPLQWAASGFTLPIDEVADRIGRDRFFKTFLDYCSFDGKTFGLPFFSYSHVVAYRKSAFASAGINVPSTWDEMEDAAKKLTVDGKYGFLIFNKTTEVNLFQDLLPTNDAYLIDEDNEASVTMRRVGESLDVAARFAEYSPAGSLGKSAAEQRLLLLDGTGAMMATATTVAEVVGDQASDIGAFRIPIKNGTKEAASGFYAWSISRDSKAPDVAADFLAHFFEEQIYADAVNNTALGHMPTMHGVQITSPRIEPVREFYSEGTIVAENGVLSGAHFGPNPYAGAVVSKGVFKQMLDMKVIEGASTDETQEWGQERVGAIIDG